MTEEDQKAAVVAFGITVVKSAAPLVVPASFTIEEQRDHDGGGGALVLPTTSARAVAGTTDFTNSQR